MLKYEHYDSVYIFGVKHGFCFLGTAVCFSLLQNLFGNPFVKVNFTRKKLAGKNDKKLSTFTGSGFCDDAPRYDDGLTGDSMSFR